MEHLLDQDTQLVAVEVPLVLEVLEIQQEVQVEPEELVHQIQ